MTITLYVAAFVAAATGIAHSVLGERYILMRLFRRGDLPKLFGDPEFTARTIRFTWHITSVAWWGFAAVLVQIAQASVSHRGVALVVGVTYCVTAAVALAGSRGKHLSWPLFLFVGCAALFAAAA